MSSSQGVTLQPTLEGMFGEHLNNPTTVVGSFGIPLEVPVSDLETFVKLVGVELVGREDSESLGVHLDDFSDIGSDPIHQLPVRRLEQKKLTPSCWRQIRRLGDRNLSSLGSRGE